MLAMGPLGVRLSDPAVLFETDDIGRAEAAIFTVPGLGGVLGPVFLGDSPLP